jgi:hypothetical protein
VGVWEYGRYQRCIPAHRTSDVSADVSVMISGATTTPSAAHTRFHHDDSLTLNEYGVPEMRSSPNDSGASPTTMMGSFSDFDAALTQSQGFGIGFDGVKIETGFQDHRGRVGHMSEENGSGQGSAHSHRMSIGGSPRHRQDGNNTSPESAPALGMLAIGDNLNDASALGIRLSGNDGTDHSTTSKVSKDDPHDPPLWSEMKTKAGKERKRLPLACIACRRKKIRCSGEKPACKHCVRSRIPCVYKVTARKAAPRTDYMAMLDKRLKRMEDRVVRLIPKESLPSVANVGRSVVKPSIPGAPPKTPTIWISGPSPKARMRRRQARPHSPRTRTTANYSPKAPKACHRRTSRNIWPRCTSTLSTVKATLYFTSRASCGDWQLAKYHLSCC